VNRIEAAEKEVVRAAMAAFSPRGWASSDLSALWDACARLRDLRERAKEEECHAVLTHLALMDRHVKCHLPRGHEGLHQGELGLWRWM